jgi:hypothetical protein
MPTAGKNKESMLVGSNWKAYAAGGPYDFVADSPDGKACARLIVMLAAGDLTHAFLPDGATDRPLIGLPAGYQHMAACSGASPTVAIVVYW